MYSVNCPISDFLKILHFEVGFKFSISVSSIGKTVVLFAVIFSMTLIYNLLQIKFSNTMELLLGGKKGEKEPKTKWLMTIFGVAALAVAYYIALTTESPMEAAGKLLCSSCSGNLRHVCALLWQAVWRF